MPRRRPPTLREAQRADVESGVQPWEHRDALLSWDTRLVHKAKRWTRVAGAVAGLLAAAGGAIGTAYGYTVKLWRVVTRGSVGKAEVPETHQPTVATDRVDEPHSQSK